MKKQITVVLVCVVFLLSIASCAAPEDKVIASLGEYEKNECIVAFCYNDSFIGVKQLEINNDGTVVQSSDSAVFSYYLVDVANDLLLGPYSEEEYYSQILACNAGPMCSWISTDTPPEIGEGGVT